MEGLSVMTDVSESPRGHQWW